MSSTPERPVTPVRPGSGHWGSPPPADRARATERRRQVVEGLPDWEPLPPGERLVNRPGSGR